MKKLLLLALPLLAISFSACSDDDDTPSPGGVPTVCTQAFQTKYPTVTNAKWEKEGTYYTAEWSEANGMREIEAWFNPALSAASSWSMTETDYGKNLFMVPTGLNVAFNQTSYATSTIDEISLYEYPDATRNVYVIEVTPAGAATDVDLIFAASDFSLVKTVPDTNLPVTPDTQF